MQRYFFRWVPIFVFAAGIFLSPHGVAYARVMMAAPDLYAYETPDKIMVGAVFGIFQPDFSDAELKLIAIKSPVCKTAEIHNMVDDNGIMRMRKVDSLSLDRAGRIVLEPTGHHIMLMNLSAPLKEGIHVPVTFIFSNGTEKTVDVPVIKRGVRK